MVYPKAIEQYGRWEIELDGNLCVNRIQIHAPYGHTEFVDTFQKQPIAISYDEHGYEQIKEAGKTICCARYTPQWVGYYRFDLLQADKVIHQGSFQAIESENQGYIQVSPIDNRYFAYSTGASFLPIGINLAYPTFYDGTDGSEFGLSGQKHCLGLKQYESWFKQLSENGVNVARIWLGHVYFTPDTENAERFNLAQFAKVDAVVALAEKYHIKLKMTFEQFRAFFHEQEASDVFHTPTARLFNKRMHFKGRFCQSMAEWLRDPLWKDLWISKVKEYLKRYGNSTGIFCFELWNEMNAVGVNDFDLVIKWNQEMLRIFRALSPKNIWVNSLGSLDCRRAEENYTQFHLPELDFVQIHRYLDQGAASDICRHNPIDFVQDAASCVNRHNKPLLLAETGAVNDCHSGLFRYYSADHKGLIFADCVYTPLFCGYAGSGQIWHWDARYVESKNLYKMYQPFHDLTKDIDIARENFICKDCSDENVWLMLLYGKHMVLGYVRNKQDNWEVTLRDARPVHTVKQVSFHIQQAKSCTVYPVWEDDTTAIDLPRQKIENVKHGTLFKVLLQE